MQLAAYDVVSLAVIDEAHRLVGAVTIDDVLDRLLPARLARRRADGERADGPRRRPLASRKGTAGRPRLRPRPVRRARRAAGAVLRHAALPHRPDDHRDHLDRAQRRRSWRCKLRSVPVHPAQPGVLHPGRLRRAADPAGPEPPGRPRQGRGRARPRHQRPLAGRDRVPGARDRGGAPGGRPEGRPRRDLRGARAPHPGGRAPAARRIARRRATTLDDRDPTSQTRRARPATSRTRPA